MWRYFYCLSIDYEKNNKKISQKLFIIWIKIIPLRPQIGKV